MDSEYMRKRQDCSFCWLRIEHVVKGLKSSWRHLILHKQGFATIGTDKHKSNLTGSPYLRMPLRKETWCQQWSSCLLAFRTRIDWRCSEILCSPITVCRHLRTATEITDFPCLFTIECLLNSFQEVGTCKLQVVKFFQNRCDVFVTFMQWR